MTVSTVSQSLLLGIPAANSGQNLPMDWDWVDENDGGPTYMSLSASSKHPGGVNALFADGSVRFIKNTVSPVDLARPRHDRWWRGHQLRLLLIVTCDERLADREPALAVSSSRLPSLCLKDFEYAESCSPVARFGPGRRLARPLRGCGSGQVAVAPLVPVKGKVTYKGKALTVGNVRFEPDGYGRMATGKLQSDGTFVLSTTKKEMGPPATIASSSPKSTRASPRIGP